jgi:hypothetical protein
VKRDFDNVRHEQFQSEDEEHEFWATHDSTEFIDWQEGARRTFPNHQSLLKVFLAERLEKERRRA